MASTLGARFEKLAELGADEYVPEGQGSQLGSHESDPFQDGETLVYQQAGPAPVAAEAAAGFQIFEADIYSQVGGQIFQLTEKPTGAHCGD